MGRSVLAHLVRMEEHVLHRIEIGEGFNVRRADHVRLIEFLRRQDLMTEDKLREEYALLLLFFPPQMQGKARFFRVHPAQVGLRV